MITGTSTGGIIALGLGIGMRPREILRFYVDKSAIIFANGLISSLRRLWRNKHNSDGLEKALRECFGDVLLGSCRKRLVIPSYNIGEDDVYLFKTPHHERLTRDYKVLVWKVAMATCAAPTYFPSFRNVDHIRLVDGGVWANNPKGYAEWFKERMKIQFEVRRIILAESISAKAEDVPDYKVKTTLQRAVQILKRHRDIMFDHNPDDKPISMIITTLAAHAYNNEADLYDAMDSIIKGMPNYILTQNGFPWIPNPVNPDENFADKWKEDPKKELNFRKWLFQVEEDLVSAFNKIGIHKVADRLKPAFGERAVNEAMKRMGDDFRSKRESGLLNMAAGTGILGNMGTTSVRDHTFYGE